jgi:cytoskeletal protein RodZ
MNSENKIFIGLLVSLSLLTFLLIGSFYYFISENEHDAISQQQTPTKQSSQKLKESQSKISPPKNKEHSSQKKEVVQSSSDKTSHSEPQSLTPAQTPISTTEASPTISKKPDCQEIKNQQAAQQEVARQQAIAEAKLKAQALKDEYEARGYNVTINQK